MHCFWSCRTLPRVETGIEAILCGARHTQVGRVAMLLLSSAAYTATSCTAVYCICGRRVQRHGVANKHQKKR